MNRSSVKVLLAIVALAGMLVFAGAVAAMPPLEFSSNFHVQNLEDDIANVVISFYDIDGDGTPAHQVHDQIEASADALYWMVLQELPDNWSGSAVIGSDREIRVINNIFTEDWEYQASAGGYLGGADTVSLPIIQMNNNEWDTWFNVQNVGPEETTITATFYPGEAGIQYTPDPVTLAPFTSHTFDQRLMEDEIGEVGYMGRPEKVFIGSVVVESDTSPIVAGVVEGNEESLLAYDGFTVEGTRGILVAPLFHTNHNGVLSSVHIQNNGDQATDVTVTYVPSIAGVESYETRTIEPGAMQVFGLFAFHEAWTTLSPNSDAFTNNGYNEFIGAAYVSTNSTDQPLVGEVQQFSVQDDQASAYNAAGSPDIPVLELEPALEYTAPVVLLPEVADRNNGVWTSINLFNAAEVTTTVTIDYVGRLERGQAENLTYLTDTFELGPRQAATRLHAAPTGGIVYELGYEFVGSATVSGVNEDASDAMLVAVVNKTASNDTGDILSTYNGYPMFETVEP